MARAIKWQLGSWVWSKKKFNDIRKRELEYTYLLTRLDRFWLFFSQTKIHFNQGPPIVYLFLIRLYMYTYCLYYTGGYIRCCTHQQWKWLCFGNNDQYACHVVDIFVLFQWKFSSMTNVDMRSAISDEKNCVFSILGR